MNLRQKKNNLRKPSDMSFQNKPNRQSIRIKTLKKVFSFTQLEEFQTAVQPTGKPPAVGNCIWFR